MSYTYVIKYSLYYNSIHYLIHNNSPNKRIEKDYFCTCVVYSLQTKSTSSLDTRCASPKTPLTTSTSSSILPKNLRYALNATQNLRYSSSRTRSGVRLNSPTRVRLCSKARRKSGVGRISGGASSVFKACSHTPKTAIISPIMR